MVERRSFIVWLNDFKHARVLERYGTVHYVSRRMKYAVLYIHADREKQVLAQLKKHSFVRKVDPSYRHELKTEYSKSNVENNQFYTF